MADTKKLSNTELSLSEKLNRIQVELKAPKDKLNKFGGYNYRSAEGILEALKPLLKTYGVYVTLSDEIVEVGGRVYVKATAKLCERVGGGAAEVFENSAISVTAYAREAESKKGMDEAQVTGATSSYARKYALNGLFLLDDTKDADTDEYALQTKTEPKKVAPAVKAPAALICERCGKPISNSGKFSASKVAESTKAQFGKQMCFECGKATKAEREKPTESVVMEDLGGLPFPIED
jgi:hypothetical protein